MRGGLLVVDVVEISEGREIDVNAPVMQGVIWTVL